MRVGFLLAMVLAFIAGCAMTFMILRSRPEAPALAAKAKVRPDYALDGYCPVTLIDSTRWSPGDIAFLVQHEGQTFLMASAAHKEQFLSDPNRYAPRVQGHDIVAQRRTGKLLRGKRQHGLVHRERIYLFASEANLEQFASDPERYAGKQAYSVRPANYVELETDSK